MQRDAVEQNLRRVAIVFECIQVDSFVNSRAESRTFEIADLVQQVYVLRASTTVLELDHERDAVEQNMALELGVVVRAIRVHNFVILGTILPKSGSISRAQVLQAQSERVNALI